MDARPGLLPLPHPHRSRPGPPPFVGPRRTAEPVVEEIDAEDLFLEAPTPPPARAIVRPPRAPAQPAIAAPEGKVPLAKLPLTKVPVPRAPTARSPIVEVPLAPESIVDDAILEEVDASIVDAPILEEPTPAAPTTTETAPTVVAPIVVAPVVVAPIVVAPAATAAAAPRTIPRTSAPAPWVAPRGAAASGSRWGVDEVPHRTPWWRYTAVSAGLSALVTTAVLMIGLDRAAASSPPPTAPAEVVIAYDPGLLAAPSAPPTTLGNDAEEAPRLLARRVALRGTRNLAAGLDGPARSAFEEALRLDPRNRAALAGLGRLDVAAKRFASAIERLSLAVRLEPRDRELHGLLATAHGELGHERAAARHLRLSQGE